MTSWERRKEAIKALGLKGKCLPFRTRVGKKKVVHGGKTKPGPDDHGIRRAMYGQCERKRRYRSEHEASVAASCVRMRRGTNLRVYSCPYCGGWHLTKMNA